MLNQMLHHLPELAFRVAMCYNGLSERSELLGRYSATFRVNLLLALYIVASELKDPIWHSLEWQIGSFSSEATIYPMQ